MSISNSITSTIAMISIFVMLVLTVTSAIGRYIFSNPIPNLINISELLLLPLIIWFYAPKTQYAGDQITMDLMRDKLKDTHRTIAHIVFHAGVTLLLISAFLNLAASTLRLWEENVTTRGVIQIPGYLSRGIVTIGMLFLLVTLSIQIILGLNQISREKFGRGFDITGGVFQ